MDIYFEQDYTTTHLQTPNCNNESDLAPELQPLAYY